jgi:Pentapeptide repeats (8 copies)
MRAWLRSWWQKAKKLLEAFSIIFVCILVIALLVVIALTYIFNVNVPGLRGKTLWDWLQLLIIPAVLAVGGYIFNFTISRNEQRVASDNQREAALQSYIDKMSELLLHEHLGESPDNTQVESITRARTVTVFRILDPVRRISLIQFLSQAGILAKCIDDELRGIDLRGANLIQLDLSKIDLRRADFSNAILVYTNLSRANLYNANFTGAIISYADLSSAYLAAADLYHADLGSANLSNADLRHADLKHADLSDAILTDAKVTTEQLSQAKSLKGATMPDGTLHP